MTGFRRLLRPLPPALAKYQPAILPREESEPTIYVYDTFTDVEDTLLSNHTPDTDLEGGGWVNIAYSLNYKIKSSRAQGVNAAQANHGLVDSGVSECVVEAVVNKSGASVDAFFHYAGIFARYTDNNNYWKIGIHDGANKFVIWENNAGVKTMRATKSVTISGEHTIQVTLNGQTITATLDGGDEISYSSASLNETATKHGICERHNGDYIDNFKVEALS
ncbi:MAG: LamG domain-containing protein [Chloroflexota bacterium]|nr:LamG domain-containing protein [Chloroflexota bacterium]